MDDTVKLSQDDGAAERGMSGAVTAKSWNEDYAEKLLGGRESEIPKLSNVKDMMEVKCESDLMETDQHGELYKQ